MTIEDLESALSRPAQFRVGAVSSHTALRAAGNEVPSLGPLVAFAGTFSGNGSNTIFRPDSQTTPAALPTTPTVGPDDNVLELNLTTETLSFSPALGSVPNRGSGRQADIFLNGVPYLQSISDVTIPSQPTGIHVEPGIWLAVPDTTIPHRGATFWVETVEHVLNIPVFPYGHPPIIIPATTGEAGQPVPKFLVNPPFPITEPRTVTVTSTQSSTHSVSCSNSRTDLAPRLHSHAGAPRPHSNTRPLGES